MINFRTYLTVLVILGSITITTVLADTVTVNTYPYQIPGSSSIGLIVTSSGNVGIGTTNPGAPLEVANQITISSAKQQTSLNINGPSNDIGIQIGNVGTNGRNYQLLSSGGTSGLGQGSFTLYDATTGGQAGARWIVTSSGNVGIGTTNPGAPLEVANQITISSAKQQTSLNINGPSNDIGIQIGNVGTNGRNYQLLSSGGTSGLGQGSFTLYDATTGGQAGARWIVTSSGNVGIGTISPAQKLDVVGNIRVTGNIVSPNDICIGSC